MAKRPFGDGGETQRYVSKRGNVFQYRRRVPKGPEARFGGRTEYVRSLKSGDIRDAQLEWAIATADFERLRAGGRLDAIRATLGVALTVASESARSSDRDVDYRRLGSSTLWRRKLIAPIREWFAGFFPFSLPAIAFDIFLLLMLPVSRWLVVLFLTWRSRVNDRRWKEIRRNYAGLLDGLKDSTGSWSNLAQIEHNVAVLDMVPDDRSRIESTLKAWTDRSPDERGYPHQRRRIGKRSAPSL